MNLLLMRHAKSSRDQPGLRDFDRPLAGRGLKDASKIGAFLKKSGYIPDQIISSSALRARQTTQLLSEAAGVLPDNIIWNEDLYFSSADAYLTAIHQLGNASDKLMLIGHNPLMEEVLAQLTISGSDSPFVFPTAAVACLEVNGSSWKDCKKGINSLKWFLIPRLLT